MPNRRLHRYTSQLLFGKSFDSIHQILDAPVKILGRRHRILFHDPVEAALIGYRLGGTEAAEAALLHVIVDRVFSENKKLGEMFRKALNRKSHASNID